MRIIKVIEKYYKNNTKLHNLLLAHSKLVTKKAVKIGRRLNADIKFIEEAAMLHDIGIFLTNAPDIYCFGKEPYIRHGYLGRLILEREGLPKHALVCERHIGLGITKEDVIKQDLPLPKRDMVPVSIEEKIICYADKFFSKGLTKEKSIHEITEELKKFGKDKKFLEWVKLFGE